MGQEMDLWDTPGLHWLEMNIGKIWTDRQEQQIREDWIRKEDWIVQCHPWKGFLLLLRGYMTGDGLEIESRLHKLIPVLARNGDSAQVVAALSLLGIIILETRGWEPEIEALHLHVQNEHADIGSLEYVLRQFFLAQKAVFSDCVADADAAYGKLLDRQAGADEVAKYVLGRVYEKMALYLWRSPSHSHEVRWKMAVERWCVQCRDSIVARRLQSLELHPIHEWSSLTPPKKEEVTTNAIFSEREVDVIRAIIKAKQSLLPETIERAAYMAADYGDPFWKEQANRLKTDEVRQATKRIIETNPLEYRFTFFESFQGYNNRGEPLFHSRYGRRKVKQLLGLLLLQPHGRIVKDVLLDQLFGDGGEQQTGSYLHVLLHRLRDVFAKQTGVSDGWVMMQDGMILLNENRIAGVDVQEYKKMASVGHQLWSDDLAAAIEVYERATRMYRTVVAPEFEYEDWMTALRFELINHQKRMLKRLWDTSRKNGEIEKGILYGESLLEMDEWDLLTARQLCGDWESIGDHKRVIQTCKRYANWFEKEEEDIPAWITNCLKNAKST